VTATDTAGAQRNTIYFSVDKTSATPLHTQGTIFQHVPVHAFVQGTFSVFYIYSFGVMLILSRFWQRIIHMDEGSRNEYTPLLEKPPEITVWGTIREEMAAKMDYYHTLSRLNWAVLMFFWINLLVGPLVIGPIIDQEHYGAIFMWGAVADVRSHPPLFFFQNFLLRFPLIRGRDSVF